MEVILRVECGADSGEEARLRADGLIHFGRETPEGAAGPGLCSADARVSRHHFILELRGPECRLRDAGSANGTYLMRRGLARWEKVQDVPLEDGDRIKAGGTILAVWLQRSPEEREDVLAASPEQPTPSLAPAGASLLDGQDLGCIRCGSSYRGQAEGQSLRRADFLCPGCRQAEGPAGAPARCLCAACGREMGQMANADGRAGTFAGRALYLCPACGEKDVETETVIGPEEIGGYRVLDLAGRGPAGEIYKGRHRATGRLAALKLLRLDPAPDATFLRRFLRERVVLGSISHPGLVLFYEAGFLEGTPFLATEFMPDGDLGLFLSREGGPLLPAWEAVTVAMKVLDALAFLHDRGLVHHGLRPGNILLHRLDGALQPRIADVGLARGLEQAGLAPRAIDRPGALVCLAPEQLMDPGQGGSPVDVYAVGAILYHLLAGRWPLNLPPVAHGRHPGRILAELPRRPILDVRPGLPRAMAGAVDRALHLDPQARYRNAAEFQAALRASLPRAAFQGAG